MADMQNQQSDKHWGYHPSMDPTDFTMSQFWQEYTPQQHELWHTLYEHQMEVLPGRAADDYLEYIHKIRCLGDGVPKFEDVNKILKAATNWEIVAVPGLVPGDVFFNHLANRRFPCTYWLRSPEKADYLAEPDLFHDLFGHVPMLMNPYVADYIQAYGRGGLKAMNYKGGLIRITRLYWYTIEFGLINTSKGMRIYGAGILSSKEESQYAVESKRPHRLGFDVKRMMMTDYRYFDLQETYFVIDSFEELVDATKPDFGPYYEELAAQKKIDPRIILPSDRVITRGTVENEK